MNTLSTNAAHQYEIDDEQLETNANEDDPGDVLESEDLGAPEGPDLPADSFLEQVSVPQIQDQSLPEAILPSINPYPQPYQMEVPQHQDLVGPSNLEAAQPSPSQFLSICPGLPLPKSFAHAETSFTRRLMRSCLESTIQLLCSPSSDARQAYQLGRFTTLYADGPRILSCLMDLASRAATQNLELWQVPIYHHGGAGLHFPRIGIDASSQPPENWAAAGPMGPEPPSDSDVPPAWKESHIIEQLEMDGEWFDSNDVEQYLRTKGIFLDGMSSVVEISEPTSNANEPYTLPDLTSTATTNSATYPPTNIHSDHTDLENPAKTSFTPSNGIVFGNETLFYSYPVGYDMMALDMEMEDILQRFDHDININVDGNIGKDGYGYGNGCDGSINPLANDAPYPYPNFNAHSPVHPHQSQTQVHPPPIPLQRKRKYLNIDRLIQRAYPPFFPLPFSFFPLPISLSPKRSKRAPDRAERLRVLMQ